MKKKLAFVLSGGGSRGALQVGALQALLEHGLSPDLLVGTSIGAVNSTFIALHGFSTSGLDRLTATWRKAAELDLLPSNYIQMTLRAMLGRSATSPAQRIQEFFIQHGLIPELCFSDFKQPRLVIVSSDLNTGKLVLHGTSQDDPVLDALLVSTALPPWNMPVKEKSRYLMDGGVLSNLPIEAAVQSGATHIVALDLIDARELFGAGNRFGHFLDRLTFAVMQRQVDLELELARTQGASVFYLDLLAHEPVALWDFHQTDELIARGYEVTKLALSENPLPAFLTDDTDAGMPDNP